MGVPIRLAAQVAPLQARLTAWYSVLPASRVHLTGCLRAHLATKLQPLRIISLQSIIIHQFSPIFYQPIHYQYDTPRFV